MKMTLVLPYMSVGTAPRENFEPISVLDHGSGKQRMYLRPKCEHIAGPGSKNDKGYNGHFITIEEMEGCNISWCTRTQGGQKKLTIKTRSLTATGTYQVFVI